MGYFPKALIVEDIPGTDNKWKVYEPFVYYVGDRKNEDTIIVPKGFITDFASIPRFLWTLLDPVGPYRGAALIHDYLYNQQTRKRKACDQILLEACKDLGVNWITRWTIYVNVRAFGFVAWAKNHKDDFKNVDSTKSQ